jgi:hypothetical protein
VALDDLVEALAGQARPAVVDEQVALLAQADHPRAPVLQVGADRGDRVAADGHEPLLRALAPRAQDPRVEVDVADLEVDRLARAQPARVHELEQRPVAQGRGVAAGRGGEQARHLVAGEDLRELLGLARRAQVGGRVVLERPLAAQVAVEGPQARGLALQRRGGRRRPAVRPARGQLVQEPRELGVAGLERVDLPAAR